MQAVQLFLIYFKLISSCGFPVMTGFAQRLKVRGIPKQFVIASVRYDMVDYYRQFATTPAQWFVGQNNRP